jgi:hypothetical protein
MPLSPTGQLDRLVWNRTTKGEFSMKSAYHIGRDWISRETRECSSNALPGSIWTRLWQLRALGVVKNFLWRVYHNSLPTRVNSFKKKLISDPVCPICVGSLKLWIISCGAVNQPWRFGWKAVGNSISCPLWLRMVFI